MPQVQNRWQLLREGRDATILSCGTILEEALAAAEFLSKSGIHAAVWNCASVKPLDVEALSSFSPAPVFTVEEHSILGGFGSAVAEFVSSRFSPPRVHRLGIPDEFLHDTGEQHESRIHCGIDSAGIVKAVTAALR